MYTTTAHPYTYNRKQPKAGRIGITRGHALLLLLGCFLIVSLVGSFVFATDAQADYLTFEEITVQRGDTLWMIAHQYHEKAGMSIPRLIDEIVEVNNLPGPQIFPGKNLRIPVHIQQALHTSSFQTAFPCDIMD